MQKAPPPSNADARTAAPPASPNQGAPKDGGDAMEDADFMSVVRQLHVRSSDAKGGGQAPADAMAQDSAAHRLAAAPGRKLDRTKEREPLAVTPDDAVKGKLNIHQLRELLASADKVADGGAGGLSAAADKYGLDAGDLKAVLEHFAEPQPEKLND